MKRMIPTRLITWVESTADNIGYSNTYRATQINGSLRVNGSIQSQIGVYADEFARGSGPTYKLKFSYNSIVLTSNQDAVTINDSGVTLGVHTTVQGNLSIASNRTLKIGSTTLTEEQLKKLLALIPAESAE